MTLCHICILTKCHIIYYNYISSSSSSKVGVVMSSLLILWFLCLFMIFSKPIFGFLNEHFDVVLLVLEILFVITVIILTVLYFMGNSFALSIL